MRYSSIAVLCFALLFAVPAGATLVATYGFEDGSVQGWSAFVYAATPFNSTAEAFSGTHSLLDTTDSAGQFGPGISVSSLLLPGATYMITGELRLTAGESPPDANIGANFTMFRHDPLCSNGGI